MTGTSGGGPDIGRDAILALVRRHGGFGQVALRAGLSAETIRRIALGLTSPSYQTAEAIDRAFGLQIRDTAISAKARGAQLYRTVLGSKVSQLARKRGVSIGHLLASAGLTFYDLVTLAMRGRHGSEATLKRRLAGLARLGLAPSIPQRVERVRSSNKEKCNA